MVTNFLIKHFFQIITIVVTLFSNSAYASDSMKRFLDNLEKITHESTASSTVAIVRGGKVFKTSSKQVSDDTQFYIGSASKHMTAYMMLATLHEKYPGTPLQELLAKKLNVLFRNSALLKAIGKDWISEVSLLDLLTHRSGLSDYLDSYGDGLTVPEALNKPIGATLLLKSISFDASKKHLYSNSNYLLVGKLIEETNGDTLDRVFDRLIKLRARMTSSFCPVAKNYFALKSSACCKNLAPNLNEKVFLDMSNALGAGSVISTRDDLIQWGTYLFKSSPKVIRDAMLENYGTDSDGEIINLGLNTQISTHLGDFIGHQGDIDSFSSFFGYAPKSDTLVIILSNNKLDSNNLMESLISWISEPEELASLNIHQEKLTWSWTKRLIEENELLKFAASYNEAHPEAEVAGYGPFSHMLYNDEVLSFYRRFHKKGL
jgi:CubicO group peptidase (beta-lactamase class C family)